MPEHIYLTEHSDAMASEFDPWQPFYQAYFSLERAKGQFNKVSDWYEQTSNGLHTWMGTDDQNNIFRIVELPVQR